jgi:peptide subunit release factor RF-3
VTFVNKCDRPGLPPLELDPRHDAADAPAFRAARRVQLVEDRHGGMLALFESEHVLRWVRDDHPDIDLGELGHVPARAATVG